MVAFVNLDSVFSPSHVDCRDPYVRHGRYKHNEIVERVHSGDLLLSDIWLSLLRGKKMEPADVGFVFVMGCIFAMLVFVICIIYFGTRRKP